MKTMNVQFTVIAASVLMACLLSTGCASVNKATKLPKMNNQIVMVIPVQGPPVVVDNVPLGVGVMGGMIGVGLQRTATADARRELATRLNRDAGDFRPEVILAEECAQLLRDSPIPAFRSATAQAESVVLPEAEKLLMNQPHPFNSHVMGFVKWSPVFDKWFKGAPLVVSSHSPTGDSALLCLEVYLSSSAINCGEQIGAQAMFRIVDHASRKVVGARSVSIESYGIRLVTTDSDPAAFREDFRRFANQLAKKALTKMKLL